MAIFRNKTQRYTIVSQSLVQDGRLSNKALGCLVRLLSLPDNWEFSIEGLLSIEMFRQDGRDALRAQLNQLEELGYIRRYRERKPDGSLGGAIWEVSDTPILSLPSSEPKSGFPTLVNPTLVKPTLGKPTQSNTNKSITKQSITKTHTQGREASAQIQPETEPQVDKKVAANAARECVVDSDFENFSNNKFYKPTDSSLKKRAKRQWDKLIADGYTPEQIEAKLEEYMAYERSLGRDNSRFWKSLPVFLEKWVAFEYKTETAPDVAKPSEAATPADPAAAAALRAKIAEKYEWPQSVACSKCGAPAYRIGETKMYECSNSKCNTARVVRPKRKAVNE